MRDEDEDDTSGIRGGNEDSPLIVGDDVLVALSTDVGVPHP